MSLASILPDSASTHPESAALRLGEAPTTRRELADEALPKAATGKIPGREIVPPADPGER